MIIYCKLIIQAILNKNIEFMQTFLHPQECRAGRELWISVSCFLLLWAPYLSQTWRRSQNPLWRRSLSWPPFHRWRKLILGGVKWRSHDHPVEMFGPNPLFPRVSLCFIPWDDQGLLKVFFRFHRCVPQHHCCSCLQCFALLIYVEMDSTPSGYIGEILFSTRSFFLAFLRTQNCSQSDWLLEAIGK